MSRETQENRTATRVSLKVHKDDNVVTLLDEHVRCTILADGCQIAVDIPFGHKAALSDIKEGAPIVKYGVTIGTTRCPIAKGEHVHVHNVT